MKVLLINPPNINSIESVLPSIVEDERGFNPPLGLLYIAGYLQKYSPNIDLKIMDAQAEQLDHSKIENKISDFQPDVVGISVMSFNLIDSLQIAKITKKYNSLVVFGGPHVNIYPQETLDQGNIDYIILGEGEENFNLLVNNLDNEEKLKTIPGFAFYDRNNVFVNTGMPALINDLDEIPIPARNLINNDLYSSVLGTSKLVTTMITSRGCPYKCSFCDRPHLGKVFRARSATSVVEEIKDCLKYGIKEFLMYDDTFTIDRDRVLKICDMIIEERLDIKWDIRARVNTIDQEILNKLKQAGCVRIHYGVESGTQKILDVLRKGITIKQVEDAFALTKKSGIETLAYFMIGNPTETEEDIKTTIQFTKKINPDYVHVTATMPFPATDLYRNALEQNIITKDVWLEFAKTPNRDFHPPLWVEHLSAEDLARYVKDAYHKFYFRPKYILKRLVALKSWDELKIKAKAALHMFKI